jgi:nuclear pore complex protein Nup98-Nup96
LFATLRAIGALPETVENRALGDALHANFARQLLSSSSSSSSETKTRRQQRHSMIEWAVFVAMHVEDGARRRDLVKEILNAGCAEWCDDDAKTTFMRETLRVPEAWTREAKETWARYNWWEPESAFAPA